MLEYNQKENAGIKITGMSRNPETAKNQLGDLMDFSRFTYVSADINEPLEEMGSFDYVIHCASNTHPRQYSSDPIGTIMTNVLGTKNLLDYVAAHGAGRFVFLSSVEIYGENRGDVELFAEDYLANRVLCAMVYIGISYFLSDHCGYVSTVTIIDLVGLDGIQIF